MNIFHPAYLPARYQRIAEVVAVHEAKNRADVAGAIWRAAVASGANPGSTEYETGYASYRAEKSAYFTATENAKRAGITINL
jgi:hypothetical protein